MAVVWSKDKGKDKEHIPEQSRSGGRRRVKRFEQTAHLSDSRFKNRASMLLAALAVCHVWWTHLKAQVSINLDVFDVKIRVLCVVVAQ